MTKHPRFSREWWEEGLFGDPWSSGELEDDPPDEPADTMITVGEVLASVGEDDQCADCGEVIVGAHGCCPAADLDPCGEAP